MPRFACSIFKFICSKKRDPTTPVAKYFMASLRLYDYRFFFVCLAVAYSRSASGVRRESICLGRTESKNRQKNAPRSVGDVIKNKRAPFGARWFVKISERIKRGTHSLATRRPSSNPGPSTLRSPTGGPFAGPVKRTRQRLGSLSNYARPTSTFVHYIIIIIIEQSGFRLLVKTDTPRGTISFFYYYFFFLL